MHQRNQLTLRPLARAEQIVEGEGYRFTVLTDSLIRLEYQKDGRFVDYPTQTVLCRSFPAVPFRVIEGEGSLEIVTDKLHLYYDKTPFSPTGLRIELKEGFHVYGSVWHYGDAIEDLKGTARTLDNADGAVELEPGLLSEYGFTVLDDSRSARILDDLWAEAKEFVSVDLYFFGYGHDYLRCLKDFYRLSGPTPMLPRFALGNWWSRYYKYTEESYLKLMDRFRENEIPFSTAVIDMDWHLVDIPKKYGSGWTGYTWNPTFFPDPQRFLTALHDRGMKVTLNVHPADGIRAHEEQYLPMAKELRVDYEHEDKIPFDVSDRAFMDSYFRHLHHTNEERGVDFWWLDWQQGSRGGAKGLDTLWMLNHLHFLDSGRDGKDPLTFSRYAGIGSHRYPIGFSGDTFSTWESLDFQPYFTANASNAGYTWWSHDIGGHQGGRRDDELAVRWLQFGVFSPIMRLHSTSNEFYGKEPWNYGLAEERIMGDFLRLRHKLIPYLYTMNALTHRDGLPLICPMYYRHDVPDAYKVPNQYWFGTEMIVCPITAPADRETLLAGVEAWLPEGVWHDFFTGTVYRGGRKIRLYRDRRSIPVLVKAGGIVPMAKDPSTAHLGSPDVLEVHVYHGADGSFDLWEDEGTTRFVYQSGQQTLRICPESGAGERLYELHLHGMNQVVGFHTGGIEHSWSYDADTKTAVIRLFGSGSEELCVAALAEEDAVTGPDIRKTVYEILSKAQISYELKTKAYEAVCGEQDPVRLLGKLQIINLPLTVFEALMELIIAEW